MIRRTISEIKNEDEKWKPGGEVFNRDAHSLANLFDHRGRALTYQHLKDVQMGDPDNLRPLCIGTIPRLTESLSVLYRVPATRRLKRGKDILADDDPQTEIYTEIVRRMSLDNVWQIVDAKRNLLRQCALVFVESTAHQSVQSRVFAPFEMYRYPTAAAADVIDEDEAIIFQIRAGASPADNIYQLWQHEPSGWRLWIVDEAGTLHGEQPYGESGIPPFAELPIVMVYDTLPAGLAYLPIPESRLDFALNINALANDLAYLVKLEAHTAKLIITDDKAGAPTEVGPNKVHILPQGSDMRNLAHSPQIEAVVSTITNELAMLALGEALPADYFSADRKIHTGPALKTAERDLEARRQRQAPLAVETERRAFKKIRAVHNAFAEEWDTEPLDERLTLVASFGRQWQPTDARELQEVSFKDLAIGATSMIAYLQERFNVDRPTAIDMFGQIQGDRAAYPVAQQQNPGALTEGPTPALGEGGAQKVPGAFNSDLATSTEGASITDAVIVEGGGEEVPIDATFERVETTGEAPATPAANQALNGAQLTAVAAMKLAVATKQEPRETAVSTLVHFYGVDRKVAEEVMGEIGKSFYVEPPAPSFGGVMFNGGANGGGA